MENTKICNKCNTEKKLTEFYFKNKKTGLLRNYCKQCSNESSLKYKAEHSERTKEYQKEYLKNNREKLNNRSKNYYQDNVLIISEKSKLKYIEQKEEISNYNKEYYRNNREKILDNQKKYYVDNINEVKKYKKQWNTTEQALILRKKSKANRRALEKNLEKLSKNDLIELRNKSNHCYWCNVKIEGNYHFDHYIPLSKGGRNIISNLVVSCPSCNLSKNAKDPYIFAIEKGKLF